MQILHPFRGSIQRTAKRFLMPIVIARTAARNAKPGVLSSRMAFTAARWWMWPLMERSACAAICVVSVNARFVCCQTSPYRIYVSVFP
jgi:hypothetical protein